MVDVKPPRFKPWHVLMILAIVFPLAFVLCGAAGFISPVGP